MLVLTSISISTVNANSLILVIEGSFEGSPNVPMSWTVGILSTGDLSPPFEWSGSYGDSPFSWLYFTNQSYIVLTHTYAEEGEYNWWVSVRDSEGNFAREDRLVTIESNIVTIFSDGFEKAINPHFWTKSGTNDWSVRLNDDDTHSYEGDHSVFLDDCKIDDIYSYSQLTLTLDLSDQYDVGMQFWWKEFNDENHEGDGVFISDDGYNWYPVYSFNNGPNYYIQGSIDISEEAVNYNIPLTSSFKIRFQFYDNQPITSDGYIIDNVVLTAAYIDSDDDGWSNFEENNFYFTNPYSSDTDWDGVIDPVDTDPLVDLQVRLTIKRIYGSKYTYNWCEAEGNYDDCSDGPWDLIHNEQASGGYYIRQQTLQGVDDWVVWNYNVDKPGVYHVWLRNYRSIEGCSNVTPLWKNENDDNFKNFFNKSWDDKGPSYDVCWGIPQGYDEFFQWSWYGIIYAEPGEAQLKLENRPRWIDPKGGPWTRWGPEFGYIQIDSILITDDPNCNPNEVYIENGNDKILEDQAEFSFDPMSPPDFFIRSNINGIIDERDPVYDDWNILNYDWSTSANVPDNLETVPISIALYDEDGTIDELCDISYTDEICELTYNLKTATWTGDDFVDDIDFIGRTCGEVDGSWDFDANVIFEISQNDFDEDKITYWQETSGPYDRTISPLDKNDRYAIIVGAGASCKLKQTSDCGSGQEPWKGTYLKYDKGYSWNDYEISVDLMSRWDFWPDKEDIGIMFRYQDPDNYYLIRWEQNLITDKMYFWKFVDGVRYPLDIAYPTLQKWKWYTLRIRLEGNHIEVFKLKNVPLGTPENEVKVIDYYDDDNPLLSGTVALFTWRNTGAFFDDIHIKNLEQDELLYDGFDYGQRYDWTVVNEAGPSEWKQTNLCIDQEDFYVTPDYIYRELLLVAHYSKENIMYLSTDKYRDVDGDGFNDVDEVATKDSIKYLIDTWLEENSDSDDINLIYIFDHGKYDEGVGSWIAIDNDRDGNPYNFLDYPHNRIYDYEVNWWLPKYGPDYTIGRLILIPEACFPGYFIDACSDPDFPHQYRIIMPSAGYDQIATPQLAKDYPAFSYNIFKNMADGQTNWVQAFNIAAHYVEEIDPMCNVIEQKPLYDDNGVDGGHDYPLPKEDDGNVGIFSGI